MLCDKFITIVGLYSYKTKIIADDNTGAAYCLCLTIITILTVHGIKMNKQMLDYVHLTCCFLNVQDLSICHIRIHILDL